MSLFKIVWKSVAAIVLFTTFSAVNASVVNGTFNQHLYDIVNIHVDAPSAVDFLYTGGYGDPVFSLFDGTGNHLVSNDDTYSSLFSHLTQNLSAGNYSLVVSACCSFVGALTGSTFMNTDGFNSGSYWFGGSATLGSLSSYLDQTTNAAAAVSYQFNLTNAALGSGEVPEPYTIALFGIALAALGLSRFSKQTQV